MKSRIWAACLLAGSVSCALAGDCQPTFPSFIEVVVRYSELRGGECEGERIFVAIFDTGDGRHSGLITDARGNPLVQGAPVRAESCGAEVWPSRTYAVEKVGTGSSGEAITQLVFGSSTSKTCHVALDLPAAVGTFCAPPNPGIIR